MIQLTRINNAPLIINSDLIEHIETTPDTVISLTTGQKFMVLETTGDIVSRVVQFRRQIFEGWSPCGGVMAHAAGRPAGEADAEDRR